MTDIDTIMNAALPQLLVAMVCVDRALGAAAEDWLLNRLPNPVRMAVWLATAAIWAINALIVGWYGM